MSGLTEPLEFRRFMRSRPVPGFDVVPFLDALMIAGFVAVNASAFVLSPGTAVHLPRSATMETARGAPTAVLTVDRNELYFFEGRKLSRLALQDHLAEYVAETGSDREPILLLKADASITSSVLFELMDSARKAGFAEIHLAAEPDPGSEGEGSSGLMPAQPLP